MKNAMILLCALLLCVTGLAQAQTFSDYISATRGDTVVIKDYVEMGNVPNSIINAVELDSVANTTVPAGRVYLLKRGGIYWVTRSLNSPQTRAIKIEGEPVGSLVKATGASLPIFCGTTDQGTATNGDIIRYKNDVTLKNLMILPAATDGSQGWACLSASQPYVTLTLDNVLMEHNRWVMVQSNDFDGNDLIISNSYFVNMNGQPCRRNGGVYDNVSHTTGIISVENSTHVMAQGLMYKFRNFVIDKAFFNHNTFVNCVGNIFETVGLQNNWTVTNNLFINSNAQGYQAGMDVGEADADLLPTGIINVDTASGVPAADRKVLVDRNGIYWDARLNTIVPFLNTNNVIGADNGVFSTWVPTNITMNSRTQALFNDNVNYTHLTEGSWIQGGDPLFVDPLDLMTNGVDMIVEFADSAAATTNTFAMACWRTAGNPATVANYTYPDWPIPVNLAYTNTQYTSAALNGLPLGDLNWFPAQKATWNMTAEHAALETALNAGTLPTTGVEINRSPSGFNLHQNYPNPFNPSTKITFTLPHSANTSLKVVDILGREVATLVNGFTAAGNHEVQFNAANLTSGVYFYKLTSGSFSEVKKMMLVK